MQLGHERLRAGKQPGAHADLLEERDQPQVAHAVVVGENLAHVARVGESAALRHAQEEPGEPVGEVAADHQQVVVLEGMEELLRDQVLALQRADELEHVLVGYDVGRRGGEAAEQVIDDRALEIVPLDRQVGHPVGSVGDHLRVGGAVEADLVDRLLEERVERHRDVEVEVRDFRQLAQRQRRGERGLAHDGAKPRVGLLAPASFSASHSIRNRGPASVSTLSSSGPTIGMTRCSSM